MSRSSIPSKIVKNYITEFIPARKMSITDYMLAKNTIIDYTDDDKLALLISKFGYVRIDAIASVPRGSRDWILTIIIPKDSDMSTKPSKLRDVLSSIHNEDAFKTGRLYELNIVLDQSLISKNSLMNIYSPYIATVGPDTEGSSPFYNIYPFSVFSMNILNSSSVGKYRIVQDDEISLQGIGFNNRSDLSIINSNDPPIIWIGGRDGQIVEIIYDSETAGTAVTYRRIEKPVF